MNIALGIVGFMFLAFLIVCAALSSARRSAPYWDETNREFIDEDQQRAKRAQLFNAANNLK